jgi:hypothetical protein
LSRHWLQQQEVLSHVQFYLLPPLGKMGKWFRKRVGWFSSNNQDCLETLSEPHRAFLVLFAFSFTAVCVLPPWPSSVPPYSL